MRKNLRMPVAVLVDDFPLFYRTPKEWAVSALKDVPALLSDHAYLEKKAATNALDLLNRWPHPVHPDIWESTLTSIAKDEALHLSMVVKILRERGDTLDRFHKSPYASDLRKLVRKGVTPSEVLDRLLVSALIEARSCERFQILSEECPDKNLAHFYRSLVVSEAGHYKVFLHLAEEIVTKEEFDERWKECLLRESEIIQRQPVGSTLHSRCP